MNWLSKIRKLGIIQDLDDESQRRIAFSNVVFITLPVVYVTFILIDFPFPIHIDELVFDQYIVPIVICICLLCLLLNHLGRTTISRVLFIILWPLLLHIIPIVQLNAPLDYALALPFGIVFHGILIHLLFSHRSERALFWFFIIVNFSSIFFAQDFLISNDLDSDIPKDLVTDRYYLLVLLLYWLLTNLVTFYILNVVESAMIRLLSSRNLISEQKNKLNTLNNDLEQLVAQRTALLEKQNEQLRQYAFYNAHLLRAPFSNIQGLIKLQQHIESHPSDNDEQEKARIKMKLLESLDELDKRINEIQKLVESKQ